MGRTIGVVTTDHVAIGLVEGARTVGAVRRHPEDGESHEALFSMRPDEIAQHLCVLIEEAIDGQEVSAIGLGFPGIIHNGVIVDSPNLKQMKGEDMRQRVRAILQPKHGNIPVAISNDADVMAAGMAATRGQLDRLIRVWTLGNGIGFGRYPAADGVWEGGHTVVSVDPKETFCGCGGKGHLEGIMGHRAMRLRFLDLEPEEVFENARQGDVRCADFVKLWHRALAAATATTIHMDGPGKFFITGLNAGHVDVGLLSQYVQEMVKLSPLQGYVFEVVPGGDEIAVIGAAVNAERSANGAVAHRA